MIVDDIYVIDSTYEIKNGMFYFIKHNSYLGYSGEICRRYTWSDLFKMTYGPLLEDLFK